MKCEDSQIRRSLKGQALWRKAALAACALGLAAGCRVPAPTVEQGLAYGFESPQQAVTSFRTAVQGNLLSQEFRCFSREWKNRTEVRSINYYSEVRDELISQVPQLRWALYHADDPELISARGNDALLQCRIPGPLWTKDRFLLFEMHREGYWRAWTDEKPDEATEGNTFADPIAAGVLEYDDHYDVLRVNVDDFSLETDDLPPGVIVSVQGGWQWKIQDFSVHEEPVTAEPSEEPFQPSLPSRSQP